MVFERLRAELQLDTSGFRSGVNEAQDSLDGLQGKAQKTGKRMQRVGGAMTAGLTAPLTAMGGASAKAAADFDASMQQSIAVMDDVSDSMREDLEATARDVATNMSVSHGEAAESFYYLASAGLDASQAMEAMPEVAAFAEAGQMNMAQATDVATNVMSAYGYEASEMTTVTDTLAATVSSHNQTMEGMSSAMSQVAPIASSLGVSIEETSTAIGMMGDVGIQSEKAGTQLRNVLSQLSDESSTASSQLEEMGVQVRDNQGNVLGLAEVLRNMEEAGVEAGDAATIFGRRSGPAMAALIEEGGAALKENTSNIREMEGATEDIANTQRDTFNAQLNILKSNIRDVGITIGKNLLPVLNSLVDRLMPVAEWFQNLSNRQQQVAIVVGTLVAALGPLLLVVGTLLTMIPAMTAGFTALSTATLPLSGTVLAVAAAIGLLAAAWATDFMGIQTKAKEVVGAILEFLGPLITLLRDDFVKTLQVWRSATESALGGAEAAWNKHGDTIMAVIGPVLSWLEMQFDMAFQTVQFIVESSLDTLVTTARVAMAVFRGDFEGALDLVVEYLERTVGRFKGYGKAMMETLADGVKDAAGAPVRAVEDAMGAVRDRLPFSPAKTGPLADLDESGEALPETFAEGIEGGGDELESTLEGELEGLDDWEPSSDLDSSGGGYSTGRTETLKQLLTELKAMRSDLSGMNLRVETGDETLDRIIHEEAEVVVENRETQKFNDFQAQR